jgi:hypothetical protein
MRPVKLILSTLVLAAVSTAAAQTVKTDFNKEVDFKAYKTFAFKEGTPAPTPFAQSRIEAAVAAQLESRGLVKAAGDADLVIYTHTQVSKEKSVDVTNYGYGGYYGWGGWGGGWGTTSVNVREIPVGTVMVDVVDSARKEIVWRGVASDTLATNPTPEKSEKRINKAMAKLFKKYPVEPASP